MRSVQLRERIFGINIVTISGLFPKKINSESDNIKLWNLQTFVNIMKVIQTSFNTNHFIHHILIQMNGRYRCVTQISDSYRTSHRSVAIVDTGVSPRSVADTSASSRSPAYTGMSQRVQYLLPVSESSNIINGIGISIDCSWQWKCFVASHLMR